MIKTIRIHPCCQRTCQTLKEKKKDCGQIPLGKSKNSKVKRFRERLPQIPKYKVLMGVMDGGGTHGENRNIHHTMERDNQHF